MSGVYSINHDGIVVTTAITISQYKAGAANPAEVLRASITQGLSETSIQEQIKILRKTAGATVTSQTPLEWNPDGVAAFGVGGTAASGITATSEGTDGDLLVNEGWNVLNGFTWMKGAHPEQLFIPGAGIIAVKFAVAPASHTWRHYLVIAEY
jgi:hypothetical protein